MNESERQKSIFDNITDEDFEDILNECGFKYKKVERGKGGLFIDNERVTIEDINNYSLFK